jgi:hypothetical protein
VKLVFRQHAVERMFERGISVDDVTEALDFGKVIEGYPADFPYPSALWLGFVRQVPLHVVAADNAHFDERIISTAYRPDPVQWLDGWTTRRKL